MVKGGAGAAISFGIGQAAVGLTSFNKALFQAAMHGMSGGLMSALNGGNFGSGFASGMVSSVLSSAIGGTVGGSSFATNNSGLFKAIMLSCGNTNLINGCRKRCMQEQE